MSGPSWAPVVGWEGYYEVSDQGQVRRVGGNVLRQWVTRDHWHVSLYRNNKKKNRQVHQLVLEAFVGPRPDGNDGCHNDGNPANNALGNLRWDTRAGNLADTRLHGTHNNRSKIRCIRGHLLKSPNLVAGLLRRTGHRGCLACHRAGNSWRYAGRVGDLQAMSDAYYAQIMGESVTATAS